MWKSLLRDRLLTGLLILALFIRLFSLNPSWVERYYTYGLYPLVSRALRLLFGWIPFSLGDLLYVAALVYFVIKSWKFLRILARRQVKEYLSWVLFRKFIRLVLWIYIIFQVGWGLNYSRQGIEHQLQLDVKEYSAADLFRLASVLKQRLNDHAARVDTVKMERFNMNAELFRQGVSDFQKAAVKYPFLTYRSPSIKPSLYGSSGKYFGYTGYYNPFTAEAQLKTSIPAFMKPFVLNHEIAHQLGYAKENEASFVSWLVGHQSESLEVRYALYYELFFDAFLQFWRTRNMLQAVSLYKDLHPRVLRDKQEEIEYLELSRNPIEPFMSRAYDRYLKLNNQPKGKATYDEVIGWLIAYMKKYGEEEI